jgi:YihY family inner membrane protein
MATRTSESTAEPQRKATTQLVQTADKNLKPMRQFLQKFNNDWSTTFAGVLAYNLLMALLPIAIALVSILGFILGSANGNAITSRVSATFPGQAGDAIKLASMQLSKQAGFLAIIAVLLAIFGGSRLFITIENCLDLVYHLRPRPFLRQNAIAFLMLIIFIILIPVMIFASAAPGFVLTTLGNNPTLQQIPLVSLALHNPVITYVVPILGGLLAAFILFEAIYFIIPNKKMSWKTSWKGALVAAIATEIFINLFPLYVSYSLKNYTGQIGFAVILLLFFYYFAVIIMLGGEVNAFFSEDVRPIPNDLATFVSTVMATLYQDTSVTETPTERNLQAAGQAQNIDVRQQEQHTDAQNTRKKVHTARSDKHPPRTKHARKQAEAQTKQPTRIWAMASVAIGAALTIVIELLQQRHPEK